MPGTSVVSLNSCEMSVTETPEPTMTSGVYRPPGARLTTTRKAPQGPPEIYSDTQSIPGKPVSPALPQLSSLGSTHNTVARGTVLWESLVGKPRGKAKDPLTHAKESVTLLLQLERKSHVHVPTRDEK